MSFLPDILSGSAYDVSGLVASQHVRRAAHTPAAAVQEMGVDHGGSDILAAQEFLMI
jgi:hypothetical protein